MALSLLQVCPFWLITLNLWSAACEPFTYALLFCVLSGTSSTAPHVTAGTDFPGLPGNGIVAMKAEAAHNLLKAKSGTPPPLENNAFACQVPCIPTILHNMVVIVMSTCTVRRHPYTCHSLYQHPALV